MDVVVGDGSHGGRLRYQTKSEIVYLKNSELEVNTTCNTIFQSGLMLFSLMTFAQLCSSVSVHLCKSPGLWALTSIPRV